MMDFWELMRLGGNVLDTPGSIGRGMIPKKAVDIGPWYAILRHPEKFM